MGKEERIKKLLTICAVVLVVLAISGLASATVTTITFNSAEMVAFATTNTGAPAVGDGRIDGSDYAMKTYIEDAQTNGFNTWLSSMGTSEGISAFNLWLQGDASDQASWWGEDLVITDFTASITASGPTGWTASIIDCPSSWGDAFAGHKLISYSTTDPTKYIRQGNTLGAFEFSATTNGTIGENYIIWVGAGEAGDTESVLHNDNWTYGETTYNPAVSFQRAITAQAIPEPATIGLLTLGGLLLGRKK